MWFAAMSGPSQHPWFIALLLKLMSGDRSVLGLLPRNPFPDALPRWVRAMFYEYHFSCPAERRATGRWRTRREVGLYILHSRLHGAAQAEPAAALPR
jgi:hypothetical protein